MELDSQGDTLLTGSEDSQTQTPKSPRMTGSEWMRALEDSQTPTSQGMTGSEWMRALEKSEESSKTRDPTQ